MSNFTIVDEAPKKISKGEYVIKAPNFLNEIAQSTKRAPRNKLTSNYHLKDIFSLIGLKYDREFFNPMLIPYVKYEGIKYENHDDLNEIVLRILTKYSPDILSKYLDHYIKNRPERTKLIYFLGSEDFVGVFFDNGIDRLTKDSKTK